MSEGREHREYSASKADQFFVCEGSVRQSRRAPRRDSKYSIEGTNAHEVFEAALINGVRDAKEAHRDWSSLFFEDLDDGSNNFYLSIQSALNYVYAILDEHPDAQMWVEVFVDPPIESLPGQAGGYCDVLIFVPSIRTLFVIDYKHGAGIAKEADCRQVKQYAAGALYEENARIDVEQVDTVALTILQPRAFHRDGPEREVIVTPYEIWEYLQELDEKIAACEREDAPLVPGLEQCRFCPANVTCPARERAALAVAQSQFSQIAHVKENMLPDPKNLDMQRLGAIRFHAPMLRKWLDDCEQYAYELARQGHNVPGAKLVESQDRRKYYGDEMTVIKKIEAMLGSDVDPTDLYTIKPVPLTTAEKMVVEAYKKRVGRGRKKQAAEEAKQAFAFLTLKQSSGTLTLVNDDDPRPAVTRQNAFAGVTVPQIKIGGGE